MEGFFGNSKRSVHRKNAGQKRECHAVDCDDSSQQSSNKAEHLPDDLGSIDLVVVAPFDEGGSRSIGRRSAVPSEPGDNREARLPADRSFRLRIFDGSEVMLVVHAIFHRAIWYEEIANRLWQSLRQSLRFQRSMWPAASVAWTR